MPEDDPQNKKQQDDIETIYLNIEDLDSEVVKVSTGKMYKICIKSIDFSFSY